MQFHVEVDEATVEAFIATSPNDIPSTPGGPNAIRRDMLTALPRLREVQHHLATRFAELARATNRTGVT